MSVPGPIRIGLLGCGTVGTGVLRILQDNGANIEARLGVPLEVRHVVVRDTDRQRDPVVPTGLITSDAMAAIQDPEVDVIVEVVGGDTLARGLVLDAIGQRKQVVTANKALLASHGAEIFGAARAAGVDVLFEASVGGGMPVIRMLREGLVSDRVESIQAIINGTSNYILSAMTRDGAAYEDALHDAQSRGYAETDPTMDVDGIDAAQKLSILMGLGFGTQVPYGEIPTRGISDITNLDVVYAQNFGFTIKPLAVATLGEDGVQAHVGPTLVPSGSTLANVHGANNAVRITSAALGPLLVEGQGAGMLPTASAVVSDVIDAARNLIHGSAGRVPAPPFDAAEAPGQLSPSDAQGCFYLRLAVEDEPGVLGAIAACIGAEGVSIARVIQDLPAGGGDVQVVMLTHETSREAVHRAATALGTRAIVRSRPCVMGIEARV